MSEFRHIRILWYLLALQVSGSLRIVIHPIPSCSRTLKSSWSPSCAIFLMSWWPKQEKSEKLYFTPFWDRNKVWRGPWMDQCAVIVVLQYLRCEVPTIRASSYTTWNPPWVWLERLSRQNQGHQKTLRYPELMKCIDPANRTLTPIPTGPHGIPTYSYCNITIQ